MKYAELCERLAEHAALHGDLAAMSDEQALWQRDLIAAAAAIRELEADNVELYRTAIETAAAGLVAAKQNEQRQAENERLTRENAELTAQNRVLWDSENDGNQTIERLRQQVQGYREDIEREVSAHTVTIETVHSLRGLLARIDNCNAIGIERAFPAETVNEAEKIYDDIHAVLAKVDA